MKRIYLTALCLGLLLTACDQAEYLNPSAASETQVVSDVNGLITLANGLQSRYTTLRTGVVYNSIAASGLSTKELRNLNAGNTDEELLMQGGANVDANNAVVRNMWSQALLTNSNADLILKNLDKATDPGTKAGLQAYAAIFKALSLGTLSQFFEQIPLVTQANAPFSPRTDALKQAVTLLEQAKTALAANTPGTPFTGKIVPGIDLLSTVNALIARYSLFLGDYDKALSAAAAASLTTKSEFRFDDNAQNPIYFISFSSINVFQVDVTFGLPASLQPDLVNDKRIAFYLQNTTPIQPNNNAYRGKGFFTANTTAIPVYLPGEMLLIRAEALARKDQLADAVTELNKVLTKKPAADPFGVGADLPAYAGAVTKEAVLTEIFKQRSIELLMSGMKLEDSRRFGRPAPATTGAERTRNFYPYPNIERRNNTSTPADPQI